MFVRVIVAVVFAAFLLSCDNPLSPEKKNPSETYIMDNYYAKNWNVYKDNVYIGILYANCRTKFVGNFEGTHEIKGATPVSWWGPINYTFTDGWTIKDWLSPQPRGANDLCDTTNVVVVNF